MMGGGMLGLGLIGSLISLVVIVAVIGGIVLLVVWLVRQSGSGSGQGFIPMNVKPIERSTPRDILQERYARGEITRDQYQLMLSDIDSVYTAN